MLGKMQSIVAAATLAFAGHSMALSSISKTCPNSSSGICYFLNIPETTANAGNGDIYFSIVAPTSYQWAALGQGRGMSGANMFVMYASADGKNVTVSPRRGTGHVEPEHDTSTQIELLEGSGISNGMMTANVRCMNCNSWSGGTMDFSSTSGSWIHAEKSGDALNSDDLGEEISQHDTESVFTWQFASAKGGDDVNPFVTVAATNGSSSGSEGASGSDNGNTTTPATSGGTGSIVSSSDSGDSDDESSSSMPSNFNMIVMAHGIMAALAFVVLFPVGGIIMRVASFPGLVWVHAGIQAMGYVLFICAVGMGIWIAITTDQIDLYHPIIGLVLFALIVFQPLGGLLHHRAFKKTGRSSIWSYAHVWIGRVAIILGIINGGLGLMLADDSTMGERIAYGVIGGIFGLAFIAAAVFGEVKKTKSSRSSTSSDDGISKERMSSNKA